MIKQIKIILYVCVALPIIIFCSTCTEPQSEEKVITWNEKASRFVDYTITSNRVKFTYTFVCYNNSNDNYEIAVSAKFKHSELENWIEDEGLFIGEDDDGLIKYEEIKANSEGEITVCFEGEYLGGNVNKNLSFPEEIMIVLK